MRFLLAIIGLLVAEYSSAAQPDCLQDLAELKWDRRVIVVRADAAAPGALEVQSLQAARDDIDERDVVWFVAEPAGVTTNHTGCLSPELETELQRPPMSAASRVVLIGKDGGVKWRSDVMDLGGMLGLIDTMPMRHWEMQHNH